jgi:signal peptidase
MSSAAAEPRPAPVAAPRRPRFRVLVVTEIVVIMLGIGFLIFGRAGFAGSPISYVVVSGHSMEPTFHTGDVVVLRSAARYHRGQVLGYTIPSGGPGAGLIVIHRVIGGDARSGYVMRGDNKRYADPWRPRPEDVVGHELFMIPKVGLAIRFIRSPIGYAAVAGLITVMIALGGGKAPERERGGDGTEAGDVAPRRRSRGAADERRSAAPPAPPSPPAGLPSAAAPSSPAAPRRGWSPSASATAGRPAHGAGARRASPSAPGSIRRR